MTTAAELALVQSAISAILTGGQSVVYEGRTLTRANLNALYDREKELLRRQTRAGRSSQSVVVEFRNPA